MFIILTTVAWWVDGSHAIDAWKRSKMSAWSDGERSLNIFSSHALSPQIFSTLIFTEEKSCWRQKRFAAILISSPGISTFCPTERPE